MARRTARARFVRPAPRTKIWIGWGVGVTSLTGSTIHLVFTYSAAVLLLRPFTILRTRGEIVYESDQIAGSETPFGTFAEIIVTENAAGLGVTALPDPDVTAGDPDSPWFNVQTCAVRVEVADATGFDGDFGHHYSIDSKAMRKVGPNDDSAAMFSQQATVGAKIITQGRQLIQLH